jgi:hypothetical protein
VLDEPLVGAGLAACVYEPRQCAFDCRGFGPTTARVPERLGGVFITERRRATATSAGAGLPAGEVRPVKGAASCRADGDTVGEGGHSPAPGAAPGRHPRPVLERGI